MARLQLRFFSVIITEKHIAAAVIGLAALWLLGLLNIMLGSVYVLFVPGFFITLALFPPRTDKLRSSEIDGFERFVLSIALSAAIVPIVIMLANIWFGLLIRVTTIFLYIASISLFSLFVFFYRTERFREGVASLATAMASITAVIYMSDMAVRIRYILAAAIILAGAVFFYKSYSEWKRSKTRAAKPAKVNK